MQASAGRNDRSMMRQGKDYNPLQNYPRAFCHGVLKALLLITIMMRLIG